MDYIVKNGDQNLAEMYAEFVSKFKSSLGNI